MWLENEQELEIIEPTVKDDKEDKTKVYRVVAYCRVSTDDRDQRNSLEAQQNFFEKKFRSNPNWVNCGIYADKGISGTSTKKRDEFNKMIKLAMSGSVDLILTKEVSRFARNVQDLLNIVKELTSRNVRLIFLNDDIDTIKSDYYDKLCHAAYGAQHEVLVTSNRVRWGQAEKMKEGVVFGRKEMYGYHIKKDEFGKQYFEIVEEEAKIVRDIFDKYSRGLGTFTIARELEQKNIQTKRFKNGWSNTVILRMLRNEKYVGDLVQGKTYTPDPLTHEKKYNRGNEKMYRITNHHPAIIDRETWNKVQEKLKEKEPCDDIKIKHSNRYWLSGKVFCGCCGTRYVGLSKKTKYTPYKAWTCFENHQRGTEKEVDRDGEKVKVGCNAKRVNERVLKMAIHDILTVIIKPNKDSICADIIKQLESKQTVKDNTKQIKSLERKIEEIESEQTKLTREYVKGIVLQKQYVASISESNREIEKLTQQLGELQKQSVDETKARQIVEEYIGFIEEISTLSNDEVNEKIYEQVTKKIIVYPNNILEFHLRFLPNPLRMQYETSGKGKDYKATFTIITSE